MTVAVGRHRFMYQNLLTASNITPDSIQTPVVRQFIKNNWLGKVPGGARGFISGNYTGLIDAQWIVEVNDLSGGKNIGQAKFRYSVDGGQSWAASGLLTDTDPVLLEQGVSFYWDESRFGDDFNTSDRWYFKTLIPYSVAALVDYQDRGYTYRSGAIGTITFEIDLGSAGRVQSFFILDHNLSETTVVTLKGNSSASWGSPPVNVTLPWSETAISTFITASSYRYWQVTVADAGNENEYIEIGKMYLGSYIELPHRSGAHLPWDDTLVSNTFVSDSTRGVHREGIDNNIFTFPLMWEFLPDRDVDLLKDMRNTVWSTSSKIHKPVFFCPDHREQPTYMCWLDTFTPSLKHPHKWKVELNLIEVSRK